MFLSRGFNLQSSCLVILRQCIPMPDSTTGKLFLHCPPMYGITRLKHANIHKIHFSVDPTPVPFPNHWPLSQSLKFNIGGGVLESHDKSQESDSGD